MNARRSTGGFGVMACLLAAGPLAAQNVQVLAELCVDLMPESVGCEHVRLTRSENDPSTADLWIFASPSPNPETLRLHLPNAAFAGPFEGTLPTLSAADNAVTLHSEQVAFGRTPWTQHVQLEFTEGWIVSAFSYSSYDRPMGGGFSCDIEAGSWRATADRVDPESGDTTFSLDQTGPLTEPLPLPQAYAPLPEPCQMTLNDWLAAAP